MGPVPPLEPIGGPAALIAPVSPAVPAASGFGDLLASGLAAVDARVAKADALVTAFARGDTVPVHEVTLALEQARLSVELASEVRTRLLEVYRDFMSMQL